MNSTRQNFDSFLEMIDGAEAVAATYADCATVAIVSAWNGSATVNTAGLYLTTDGRIEITGFDIWTNYGLSELAPAEVAEAMNEHAANELAAENEDAE